MNRPDPPGRGLKETLLLMTVLILFSLVLVTCNIKFLGDNSFIEGGIGIFFVTSAFIILRHELKD